jgi:TldD protein
LDRTSALAASRVGIEEARRAMAQMRAPGFPRPYAISYLIRDEERYTLKAKFGSLKSSTCDRSRNAFCDVRIGSHRYDHVREGGLLDNDKESESYNYVDLPYGRNADGLRHGLWRLTDARYREAVEAYLDKKSRELTYRNPARKFTAYERLEPSVDLGWRDFPEVDEEHWSDYVEHASALIKRYPEMKNSQVEFSADHVCRIYVDDRGTRLIECHTIWSVECYLWLLSEGGDGIPWTVKHTVADPAELPSLDAFKREILSAVKQLRRLAKAPSLRSFCGPAYLEAIPAGLLAHEALGHRLEGSRLLAEGEGQTFKDSVGEIILPEFLSLREDPSLSHLDGKSLVGHYRYDDEGVRSREIPLVTSGRLDGFMSTRAGIARRHHSSGHARCAYHQRPISRMGVTILEADPGSSDAELRRRFLEEIRRQGAPFGVRIIDATSGETATDAYNFQAFLGEINLASKVYPDGREEWIRGVNFVGTPLNAVRSIVAAGRKFAVDNAYCGAESGYVPVSTISPALVVSELELQSKADTPYSPYTLPIPWASRK